MVVYQVIMKNIYLFELNSILWTNDAYLTDEDFSFPIDEVF